MREYLVKDPVTLQTVTVGARNPFVAREMVVRLWDAQKMPHSALPAIEVYLKLDPQEEARRDPVAATTMQWHRDGRGAIRI